MSLSLPRCGRFVLEPGCGNYGPEGTELSEGGAQIGHFWNRNAAG